MMMKVLIITCLVLSCTVGCAQVSKESHATDKTMFSLGGCGIANRNTTKYEELMKIVSEKNVRELSKWLHSDDLGIQLYALEGYKRLAIDIDDATKAIISSILNSKSEVFSCAGCFVNSRSVESIAKQNGYFDLLKK